MPPALKREEEQIQVASEPMTDTSLSSFTSSSVEFHKNLWIESTKQPTLFETGVVLLPVMSNNYRAKTLV